METRNKIINYRIEELMNIHGLSMRTKHVCLINSLETLFKILELYFKYGNFFYLKNCGEKTNNELIMMSIDYIKKYHVAPEDLVQDEMGAAFDTMKFYWFVNYGLKSDLSEPYRQYFYLRRFPLFKYVDEIIKNCFSERERFIFYHCFNFVNNEEKFTLQQIGERYNVTRERIRQISLSIPDKLHRMFSVFITDLSFMLKYLYYNLDLKKNYYFIDDVFAARFNRYENLNYAPRFYAHAVSALLENFYVPYFINDKKPHNVYFLVKKELDDRFAFMRFYNYIKTFSNRRIEEEFYLDYNVILKRFVLDDRDDTIELVKPICDKILAKELGIEKTDSEELIIKRNTLIKLSEYVQAVLFEEQSAMTLYQIHEALVSLGVKVPKSLESLRSSILTSPKIVAIGKTSTYALTEWGEVKTDTIKKMVYKMLSESDTPLHISDIYNYVSQYRKTSEKNILSNLKIDRATKFTFYRFGYVGLTEKAKNYDPRYIEL